MAIESNSVTFKLFLGVLKPRGSIFSISILLLVCVTWRWIHGLTAYTHGLIKK
jgi:hypothetical protein